MRHRYQLYLFCDFTIIAIVLTPPCWRIDTFILCERFSENEYSNGFENGFRLFLCSFALAALRTEFSVFIRYYFSTEFYRMIRSLHTRVVKANTINHDCAYPMVVSRESYAHEKYALESM